MRKPTKRVKCDKCGVEIVANQIGRHRDFCTGYGPRRLKRTVVVYKPCKFCGIRVVDTSLGGHISTCSYNPKIEAARKHLSSVMTGKRHSRRSIEKIRSAALNSKHRRLVRSIRTYVTKSGDRVLLDSAWEELLAKRLDALNIKWIRPTDPLIWIDSANVHHHYFPDFYLIDYDIYLDPKNP